MKAIVFVPSTMNPAPVARLILAPEKVIAGPPGVRVCVPKTNAEAAFAVKVEPEKVMTGRAAPEKVGTGTDNEILEDPM